MKYKVLALDLDGTLHNEKKEITPRTRAAIDKAIDKGVHIVLASGRPLIGVKPVGIELGLDKRGGYLLAYNGGQIVDCKTGEIVYEKLVPREEALEVCREGEKDGLAVITYDDEGIVTPYPDDRYVLQEAYNCNIPVRKVDDIERDVPWRVAKYMVVGDPEKLAPFQKKVSEMYAGRLGLYFSLPYFMEVLPTEIDKPIALARLLDYLGLERENLIACGDGYNDISMIKYAGLGVAMGNAYDEAKQAADYVTASNEEDGVAEVIEKFILAEDAE